MYKYEFSELSLSGKVKDLSERTKALYGRILSKAVADSFTYMESEDVMLLKDSVQLMEDALGVSEEIVKQQEKILERVEGNNTLLRKLVDSKREV